MWLFNYCISDKGRGFNGILFGEIIYKIDARRFFYDSLTREGRRFLVETFYVERDLDSVKEFLDKYVDETKGSFKSRLLAQYYGKKSLVIENKPVSISRFLRLKPTLELAQKTCYGPIMKGGDVTRTYERKCKFENVIIRKIVDDWLVESHSAIHKYHDMNSLMNTEDSYSEYQLSFLLKWVMFYMWRKKN